MESNWRWNIWRVGMVGAGWELCARLLPASPVIETLLVKETEYPNDARQYLRFLTPGSIPFYAGSIYAEGSFPWGYPVEED